MFDTDTLAPGLLPGVAWSQFEPSGLLTDLLSGLDVGRLDADDALETAAAWERLVAHAQAQQFRALARFASLQEGPDSDEFTADEVAPVLHLSRGTAGARLDLATRLSTQLPDTLAELQSGTIDLPKARAISEATEVLDEAATAAVQARVLPKAATQTVGELRAALSRAVLAVDPDAANRRHRAARNDRRVQLHPHPDGMGAMWALLPADDATAAYARLDALARDMDADDPRGMDARRADIFTDLLLGRDVRGEKQTTVEVQVNLDAATLAGLADNPGELAGYGPIPAEMARELATKIARERARGVDVISERKAAALRQRTAATDRAANVFVAIASTIAPTIDAASPLPLRVTACRIVSMGVPCCRARLSTTAASRAVLWMSCPVLAPSMKTSPGLPSA